MTDKRALHSGLGDNYWERLDNAAKIVPAVSDSRGSNVFRVSAVLTDEARQMLAAYENYCEKLRAYGEKLFEETFAFYDDIPKREVHKKEKRHE